MEGPSFVSALERVIAAPFDQVLEIALSVDGRTRARLAVACFSRAHLREKGIAIAAACRLSDLTAESSAHVADSLRTHADHLCPPKKQSGVVTLARG